MKPSEDDIVLKDEHSFDDVDQKFNFSSQDASIAEAWKEVYR